MATPAYSPPLLLSPKPNIPPLSLFFLFLSSPAVTLSSLPLHHHRPRGHPPTLPSPSLASPFATTRPQAYLFTLPSPSSPPPLPPTSNAPSTPRSPTLAPLLHHQPQAHPLTTPHPSPASPSALLTSSASSDKFVSNDDDQISSSKFAAVFSSLDHPLSSSKLSCMMVMTVISIIKLPSPLLVVANSTTNCRH